MVFPLLQLAPCLAILLVTTSVSVVQATDAAAAEVIRLSYRFAFEDEGVLEPDRRPTAEEVKAVLCQTDVFLTKSLQTLLENPALAVVVEEADYAFDDYKYPTEDGAMVEMPASLNFTLGLLTMDGTTLPTNVDIQRAFTKMDYGSYLTEYVWKAAPVTENYFFEARGVVWKSKIQSPVEGAMGTIDCPEGAQPDALASSGKYFGVYASITARAGPNHDWFAGAHEQTPPSFLNLQYCFCTSLVGSEDGSKKVEVNETGYGGATGFSLQLGFWEDHTRLPTDMEWEALICEMDTFINKKLQSDLKDITIASYAEHIHWQYLPDEYLPAQVNFSVTAFFGNDTQVAAADIFETLQLTDVAAANFTSDYINKAFPDGFNIFSQVDKLSFRGVTLEASDPATTLARATCPVTVRATDLPTFELKFEFEDEVEREPKQIEIEAVICQANKFFERTLRDTLGDPSIAAYATDIDWTYNPADEFSSIIQFKALTLNGDGSHVKGTKVFEIMQKADVQFFTEHYILNAVPYEQNIYYFSKNLFFSGGMGEDQPMTSKIPNGVKCKNYDSKLLPAFSIQVGFESRTGAPTQQEIEGLLCQTDLYFEKRLREDLKDDSINSHSTNVDWEYNIGEKYPAIVNFTSFSTYGDGSLVPAKLVYDVMKVIDIDDYVRTYVWNSQPYSQNIYYDTKDILFGGMINAHLLGEGKLAKVTCQLPGLATGGAAPVSAVVNPDATKEVAMDPQHFSELPPHS